MQDKTILGASLFVFLNQRNKAIGISHETQFLRGLSDYIRNGGFKKDHEATKKIARAAYLQALIEEYQGLARRLTEHIMGNIDDQDTRNNGLEAMKNIDSLINYLVEALEAL
jgi:hypothetical protein